MNTRKALIDVHEKKLTLRVGDESISFDVLKLIRQFDYNYTFIRIDVILSQLNLYPTLF